MSVIMCFGYRLKNNKSDYEILFGSMDNLAKISFFFLLWRIFRGKTRMKDIPF